MMSSVRSRLPDASEGDQAMSEIDLIVSQIGAGHDAFFKAYERDVLPRFA